MKSLPLILFLTGLALDLSAQTPTPTSTPDNSVPFNPFQNSSAGRVTPTPTVSKRVFSTVPNPPVDKNSVPPNSTSGAARRDSSVAYTSPTPPPNNRRVTFGNGATVMAEGNNLIVTSAEGRVALPRRAGGGPPSYPPGIPSDCKSVKHWLDTHKANTTRWRITLEMWFEACGF
jgi:hypothetical protein